MTIDFFSVPGAGPIALLGTVGALAAVCFAAGLLIGLLFKSAPGHLVAGILLKANRPFRRGDIISVGDLVGTVASIRWVNTRLVLADNSSLVVPNIDLMGSRIVNHTAMGTRRIDIAFGIAHGGDIEAAVDIIAEVLSKDHRVLPKPPSRIAIAESATGGLLLNAQPWVAAGGDRNVCSQIEASIHELFTAEGIRVHVLNGGTYACRHGAAGAWITSAYQLTDRLHKGP